MDLLAFAKNVADRVEAESARVNVPVAVCVIDIHGNIVLKHRMSGAPTFTIEISERKASPFHHSNPEVLEDRPLGVISFPLSFVSVSPLR
jgi:hypothetical protein